MASKFVRARSNPFLIAAGIALLLLAVAQLEATNWNDYRIPVGVLTTPVFTSAILGIVLLLVTVFLSKFARTVAVIIATFLIFGVAFTLVTDLVFGLAYRPSWWTAFNLAIVACILWPSLFPWSWSANKPVLFWMGLTFGVLTLLLGSASILARF